MSDYETIQRKRNMVVGIFVVIGICAFAWLIYKFGDLPIATHGDEHQIAALPDAGRRRTGGEQQRQATEQHGNTSSQSSGLCGHRTSPRVDNERYS